MPNNNVFYPYTSPVILTDDLFVQYGGNTGTSTQAIREIAYFLSEWAISHYIPTLLKPAVVTGTYSFHPIHPMQLDWAYVNSIDGVTLWSKDGDSSCTMTSQSSCAYIDNGNYAVIDPRLLSNCGCAGIRNPHLVEVAYNVGLPSGTVYNSPIMLALTLQAQVELNELTNTNATPGDVGIIEWANQEYRERRQALANTSFGSTAVAQKIKRLLKNFSRTMRVGL